MLSRLFSFLILLLGLAWLGACGPVQSERGPLVLAPSSMQEAITAAAGAWADQGHAPPVVSFAGTPALARQVLQGAPANLFISADEAWMDELERAGRIDGASRADLAGNRLVLIAPAAQARPVRLEAAALLRRLGDAPLALADPEGVPAGRYGKTALERLGLAAVARRVSSSENVRAALALVERGETPLGIVYASDAQATPKVAVVAEIPAAAHPPIRYPIARVAGAENEDAEAFRIFLLSPQGQEIIGRYGFVAP